MLTALQERILRIVADLPEAGGFALAGGAALIVHGIVERPTEDLDFFSTEGEDVARILPALDAALVSDGLRVAIERRQSGFARITVDDGADVTTVDLGYDFRLRPAVRTPLGPVLSEEEVAADKTLTLFGRAEARDFIDVFHLAQRFGFDKLCELALAKDAGFSRPRLAEALGRFEHLDREHYDIDDDTFRALSTWVASLRLELGSAPRRPEPPGLSL